MTESHSVTQYSRANIVKNLIALITIASLGVVVWVFMKFGPGVGLKIDELIEQTAPTCKTLAAWTHEHRHPPQSLAECGIEGASSELEYRVVDPNGVRRSSAGTPTNASTWELRIRASPEIRLVRRGDDDYPAWEFGSPPPTVIRGWAQISVVE